jgi:predicted nucleic acid-binding protein
MAVKAFVDTSGFYALLVKKDSMHKRARGVLDRGAREGATFVTSDYVLDETATLLKARGYSHLLADFFRAVMKSSACRIEWMDPSRFAEAQALFTKHRDKEWSFTDCCSFVLMRQLRIVEALTKDEHFREAGFLPVLL